MKGTRQGDFSRFPLERRKRYSAVHMQQGRVHLDADWNEQADLFDHRVRTAIADLLGADGAPAEAAGFGLAAERRCLELGLDQQYVLIGGREGWRLPGQGIDGSGFTAEVRLLARTEGQVFGVWVQRDDEGRPRPACALHLRDGALAFHRAGVPDDLVTDVRPDLRGRLLRVAVSWSPAGSGIYLDGERLKGDDQGFSLPPGRVFLQVGGRQAPLLEGLFYDFRFWGCLRTAEDLASHRDRELGGDEPHLLGYWRFDGDGASVPDRTPYAQPPVTDAVVRGSSAPPRWLPADLRIGAGRYYVDGVLCEGLEPVSFTAQPETPETPMPQPAGRDPEHHVFYLDVWERAVSAVEDPELREIALGGPDTATRSRVMAQVKSLPLPVRSERLTAREVYEIWPRLIARELARGRMAATRQRPATPRLENRLYRVEVHDEGDGREVAVERMESVPGGLALTLAEWDGGWRTGQVVEISGPDAGTPETPGSVGRVTGADPGARSLTLALEGKDRPAAPLRLRRIATLKWSRDNASIVYPLSRLDAETGEVTLAASPTGVQGLEEGTWVEVIDTAIASGPAAEPLWKVASVRSTEGKVRLAGPLTGAAAKPGDPAFLRRWDQEGRPLTSWGVLPAFPGRWLDLEAGIQVRFDYDGPYRTGDYWGLSARGLSQDIQWPRNPEGLPRPQRPHGVEHRCGPLALLTYEPEGYRLLDLRRTFQPYVTGAVSKAGDWMDGPLDVRAGLWVQENLEVRGEGRFAAIHGPLRSPDAVGTPQLVDGAVTPRKLDAAVGLVPDGYSILGPEVQSPRGYATTGWSFNMFSDAPQWTDRRQVPGGPPGPLQSVVAGGKVYTLLESGVLWELDPAVNLWRPRRELPSPGRDFAMASLQGRVYVAGGLDAAGRSMPQLFEYDPAADAWTQRAAPRTPRSSFALVACGGWLHALGGLRDSFDGKCVTSRHEAWDPVTDTWHSRRPLPRRVRALAGAALGDRINIVGGETRAILGRWGLSLIAEHHQYSPAADRWLAPRAPLPSPRRSPRLVEVYGRLYVVGGEGALGWLADFDAYDPGSDSWRSQPPLHEPLEAPGVAAVGGSVYVTGAVRPGGVLIEECPVALELFVHRRQPSADAAGAAGEPRWS